MRGSGKHTQEHHLIRSMAPEQRDDAAPAAEQRLISIGYKPGSMNLVAALEMSSSSFTSLQEPGVEMALRSYGINGLGFFFV